MYNCLLVLLVLVSLLSPLKLLRLELLFVLLLVVAGLLFMYQFHVESVRLQQLAAKRLCFVDSGRVVGLEMLHPLVEGGYHLFLSHVWSSERAAFELAP